MTMSRDELREIVKEVFDECLAIFESRNENYAKNRNALSNFERYSKIATELGFSFHGEPMTAQSVALFMAGFKVERWSISLENGVSPKDSRRDLINYTVLGEACEKAENGL